MNDWTALGYLGTALVLCAVIGLEREYRQKSAGLRTHVLVGVGSALFMLVSKYGFLDLLTYDGIALDPSRVAAQIVSGIGFIGGGLIFVRRDSVHGLTTAASVWLCASVGAAAGAGLIFVAAAGAVMFLLVAFVFPLLTRRIPRAGGVLQVRVDYADGRGLLRDIIHDCTSSGFHVTGLRRAGPDLGVAPSQVGVLLELSGRGSADDLLPRLSGREGITNVMLADDDY